MKNGLTGPASLHYSSTPGKPGGSRLAQGRHLVAIPCHMVEGTLASGAAPSLCGALDSACPELGMGRQGRDEEGHMGLRRPATTPGQDSSGTTTRC